MVKINYLSYLYLEFYIYYNDSYTVSFKIL